MGPCPMSYILIFAAFLSDYKQTVIGGKLYKNADNIGTVLFEKSEGGKRCWSTEEFAILNSRRMFQDILPQAKVINSQNDQYIALLMDYFHICLECVRKLSIGKTKHLMLKALADTMGGYLKVHILPLTKHSYYAGNIKYRNAKRLYELFEELKSFLHTNGDGWRSPSEPSPNRVKIPPIVITPSKSTSICDDLVTYSKPEGDARKHRSNDRKKKRLAHHRRRLSRHSATGRATGQCFGCVSVPLPFLDDNVQPNSIALPFKKANLHSLQSEKAAFALVKYYVASVKCIASKARSDNKQLDRFNGDLYEWLRLSVVPHLKDDKWYPAFGGVLRVMASLKELGYGDGNNKGKPGGGEYQVIPQFITGPNSRRPGTGALYNYGFLSFGTTELVVIALASALLVWLLVGLSLVCYRFLTRHSEECGRPCQEPPIAVLYENEDYCVDETCPSKITRKGIVEKLKEFWQKMFGGCQKSRKRYEDEERCLASMNYSSKDTLAENNSTRCVQKNQYKKSCVSRSTSPRERRSCRRSHYTSDDFTTNSDSPT